MDFIQSRQNALIKHVRALDNKKYRDTKGQFFIEGINMVEEAIDEDVDIDRILVSEVFDWNGFKENRHIDEEKYDVVFLEESLFEYIAKTKTPQGIAAVIDKRSQTLESIFSDDKYFVAILDGVQDPGNVGTIIRTLDCAGADGVILLDGCADPYGPKALRATMGSIFRVPIYETIDEGKLFLSLKDRDTHIMISHLQGENLFAWNGGYERIALIVGNEGRGVRDELLEHASSLVKIPILGGAESLNASVASGIIIYEIVKKNFQ